MTVLLVHRNPARIADGRFTVDRKFLLGMQNYVEQLRTPLITVHPELADDRPLMDAVAAPCAELPYRVMTVKVDRSGRTLPGDLQRLSQEICASRLVYGSGLGAAALAHASRTPYIPILEYDLHTQIVIATQSSRNPLRQGNAAVRCGWEYFSAGIPEMRKAHSLHCNGYPMYRAAAPHNPNRLLFLDSRMASSTLIPLDQLAARLAGRPRRPLRLLHSGRYERLKGTDHALRVGIECQRRGLDVEMHMYGQGSLRPQLDRLASTAPSPRRIHIHDAVPYPELVEISRSFDLFVSCHIQGDPSCTYLESFGAGLPIVGYDNRMWRHLAQHSGAGYVTPIGHPEMAADAIQRLASDHATLAELSSKALAFAREHCFEREFGKRTEALNTALH